MNKDTLVRDSQFCSKLLDKESEEIHDEHEEDY